MGDSSMNASELRNRYKKGGTAKDSELNAGQLRARYHIPQNRTSLYISFSFYLDFRRRRSFSHFSPTHKKTFERNTNRNVILSLSLSLCKIQYDTHAHTHKHIHIHVPEWKNDGNSTKLIVAGALVGVMILIGLYMMAN